MFQGTHRKKVLLCRGPTGLCEVEGVKRTGNSTEPLSTFHFPPYAYAGFQWNELRLVAGCLLLATVLTGGGELPDVAAGDTDASVAGSTGPAANATDLNNLGVRRAQAGQFEEGVALLRRAISVDPQHETARNNLSGILTDWAPQLERAGRTDEAAAALEEAVQLNSANGLALVRLGDLRYLKRGDLKGAISAWQQAHHSLSAAERQIVADRMTRAQRDLVIEQGFVARRTLHFDIRFQESAETDIAPLERVLEAAHARLSQQLGSGPNHLMVIVYTGQDLHRVYQQRDWAIGFYDGRVRLRLDDLSQPYLEDLVAHELTHAFLHHAYGDELPIWVHEGFAQFQERPRTRSGDSARIEEGVTSRTLWVPLKWLDRHFEQPSGAEDITRAYTQARLVTAELVNRFGIERFRDFLKRLSEGNSTEKAYDLSFSPSRWARADQGIFE